MERAIEENVPQAAALSSSDHLLRFSSAIPREDLDEMERVIEEGCENIDDGD